MLLIVVFIVILILFLRRISNDTGKVLIYITQAKSHLRKQLQRRPTRETERQNLPVLILTSNHSSPEKSLSHEKSPKNVWRNECIRLHLVRHSITIAIRSYISSSFGKQSKTGLKEVRC